MHLAKGLEFRAVAVVACDDEVLPLQSRIENVADEADLEDTYSTERHLLYVACTRARDRLLVTGVEPASEFLDDLYRWVSEFAFGEASAAKSLYALVRQGNLRGAGHRPAALRLRSHGVSERLSRLACASSWLRPHIGQRARQKAVLAFGHSLGVGLRHFSFEFENGRSLVGISNNVAECVRVVVVSVLARSLRVSIRHNATSLTGSGLRQLRIRHILRACGGSELPGIGFHSGLWRCGG